jgi:hypothetical protein
MDRKLTLREFDDLPPEEQSRILGRATRAAIAKTHAMGRPSVHGDRQGIFELYPDGSKKYIKKI